MLENEATPTPVEGRKPTYEELETRLAQEVSRVTHYQKLYNESTNTINKACNAIQDVLAGDMDAQETFETFKEAFELLGVELMVERSWTVQATWTVTGKVPLDYVVDADDFEPDLSLDWHSQIEDMEANLEGMDADQD